MLDPRGIQEFVCVVELGSFTAAADAMHVSTSFVSRQIKRLEERLQARLLHRTTRAIRPTEMGRVFFERSREILDGLKVLEDDMADLQHHPRGLIRVTAAGVYAERFVAPAVADFVRKYSEVSVRLDAQSRIVDIVAEGYDLAVRMSSLQDSSLIARKVAPRRVLVCASPYYLAKSGWPRRPEDLRSHNCLCLPGMPWRFENGGRVETVGVSGSWASNNGRALVAAAVRGIGLIRLSDYYVDDELRRGELVPVLEEFEVSDAATWLMYSSRLHLPTRTRLLIDHLAVVLAGTPALKC